MAVRTPPFVPRAANASCLCQLPTPPFKQHKLSTNPPSLPRPRAYLLGWPGRLRSAWALTSATT